MQSFLASPCENLFKFLTILVDPSYWVRREGKKIQSKFSSPEFRTKHKLKSCNIPFSLYYKKNIFKEINDKLNYLYWKNCRAIIKPAFTSIHQSIHPPIHPGLDFLWGWYQIFILVWVSVSRLTTDLFPLFWSQLFLTS